MIGLEYDQISYNEVIFHLEQEWKRKLTEHEINVLLWGYRFGRYIEMCEWVDER
jgi:predicted protein tyrosine phosphatase